MMINELKKKFGRKCSAINVNGAVPKINIPTKQMKFCEAVHHSFCIPIQINNKNLGCPGARRSIGFDRNDQQLASFISENTNIPVSFITDAFTDISTLNNNIEHVNLGVTDYMESVILPDLYIIYVHPVRITEIMHIFAQHKIQPIIPTYSLLSVCGNVFANSYINKVVSISFGCPESRKFGGIEENEVVIGVPANLVKYILN